MNPAGCKSVSGQGLTTTWKHFLAYLVLSHNPQVRFINWEINSPHLIPTNTAAIAHVRELSSNAFRPLKAQDKLRMGLSDPAGAGPAYITVLKLYASPVQFTFGLSSVLIGFFLSFF